MLLVAALLAVSAPALAAGPAAPAKRDKPPSCPKGQIEITSKVTGAIHCAAIGGVTVMGGPQPILILPEKPAQKPKR
jgi:hypothetical protein